MENLYQKISEDPFAVGLVITAIVAVLGWLLGYASRNAPRIWDEWLKKRRERRRRQYHAVIDGAEFVRWRDMVLKDVYGEKHFTHEMGCDFPVCSLECAEPLPYSSLHEFCDAKDIPFWRYRLDSEMLLDTTSLDNQTAVYPNKRQIKKYRNLLVKLKYPKLMGFTLDRYAMTPDGKITKVYPLIGRYEQTVFSSLILEYEMYEVYRKCKGKKKIVLDDLPLRSAIHKGHTVEEVLFTGVNRYSLLSVQGLIIFFDPQKGWVTLIARRSNNVTAKAGYDQFLPAGGFELFIGEGDCTKDIITENYSLPAAFFREYLEEVFCKPDFGQTPPNGYNPLTLIMNDACTMQITDLIEAGRAHFELMGSAVDLVNLRHDLSFILRIDDKDFHKNIFKFNDEFDANANKIRHTMPLKDIENNLNGRHMICQASVGLYNMAKRNRLYQQLKKSGFKPPSDLKTITD